MRRLVIPMVLALPWWLFLSCRPEPEPPPPRPQEIEIEDPLIARMLGDDDEAARVAEREIVGEGLDGVIRLGKEMNRFPINILLRGGDKRFLMRGVQSDILADRNHDELVQLLGHDHYLVRNAVHEELVGRGIAAADALRAGQVNEEPEIRLRSALIARVIAVREIHSVRREVNRAVFVGADAVVVPHDSIRNAMDAAVAKAKGDPSRLNVRTPNPSSLSEFITEEFLTLVGEHHPGLAARAREAASGAKERLDVADRMLKP